MEVSAERSGSAQRLALAVGLAALAGIVAAVLLLSGGEDDATAAGPLPAECVREWNGDRAATSYGRHNFNFHLYKGALVTYLDRLAEPAEPAEGGLCAVIFPAEALDPEPIAAGQILTRSGWRPISAQEGVELTRVGELQVTAAGAPNASLETTGKLGSL